MTWVIGRAGPFGYAVGLSDIRITLPNGSEKDCLQKIYNVGPMLALGFAGSVVIGLEIVNQLSAALSVTENNSAWNPLEIAEHLHIGTKEIFNSFPQKIRAGGCHLMLLSAHPTENDGAAPWARCYVHRFRHPDFRPLPDNPTEIVSIGSGSQVKHYIDALRNLEKDFELLKMETMMPQASALGLAMSVTSAINKNPVDGISPHLHICLVGREGIKLGNNDTDVQDHPEENFTMPPVAQSWEELQEILKLTGSSKSIIEQARC